MSSPLLADAREHPELFDFKLPATADEIAAIESALQVSLPPSFTEVLMRLGQGTFFDNEILLGPHEAEEGLGDMVGVNREMRKSQRLSEELIVFHLGLGGLHAFDLGSAAPEYEVVALDEDTLERGEVFPSFDEWYVEWLRGEYASTLGLD